MTELNEIDAKSLLIVEAEKDMVVTRDKLDRRREISDTEGVITVDTVMILVTELMRLRVTERTVDRESVKNHNVVFVNRLVKIW